MNPDVWLLLGAGFAGGIVNAVAGGAKLFVFPLLLASGLPPLAANATGTVALWPAQLPAAWVYRKQLIDNARSLALQLVPALAGGLFGALALIWSPEDAFVAVIPFLLSLAVGAILLGKRAGVFMQRVFSGRRLPLVTGALLFATGFYGGYFGAGLGFMLLAVLSASAAMSLDRANAAKNLFAFAINSVAVIPLSFSGLVDWRAVVWVLVGGVAGGYAGARLARRLPEAIMRPAIAGLGVLLTLSFVFR